MKRILRKVKGFLLTVRDSMLLRYRISSCSGTLEKPLKILNSKYINIGSRVRIKRVHESSAMIHFMDRVFFHR